MSEQMPERIVALRTHHENSWHGADEQDHTWDDGWVKGTPADAPRTEYLRADLVREAKREVLEDFYRRLQQHQETIVSDGGPHTLEARVRVWKRAQAAVAGVMDEMRKELDRE